MPVWGFKEKRQTNKTSEEEGGKVSTYKEPKVQDLGIVGVTGNHFIFGKEPTPKHPRLNVTLDAFYYNLPVMAIVPQFKAVS